MFLGTVLAPLFVVCKNFFLVPASANQMESKTVKGGDNVFLNCSGMGLPALFVAQSKIGVEVVSQDRLQNITSITQPDRGLYLI